MRSDRRAVPVGQWQAAAVRGAAARLPAFLRQALAPNTRDARASKWRQFVRFCQLRQAPARPTARRVAEYIMLLVEHDYRESTIRNVLSTLEEAAASMRLPPLRESVLVRRALQAARRLAPGEVRQAMPLSAQRLRQILTSLRRAGGAGVWLRARDAALFAVGWAGMMRRAELVAIRWEHVTFFDQGAMIFVPKSKTDPGRGAWVFLSARRGAPAAAGIDPVAALRRLRALQPGQGFVIKPSVYVTNAISPETVCHRLRKAVDRAGLSDSYLYSAHSLRRGGATHALAAGVSVRMIQVLGRWRSDAVRRYLFTSGEAAVRASRRMLQWQ